MERATAEQLSPPNTPPTAFEAEMMSSTAVAAIN